MIDSLKSFLANALKALMIGMLILAEFLLVIKVHGFWSTLLLIWHMIFGGNFDFTTLGVSGGAIFAGLHLIYLTTGRIEKIASLCIWSSAVLLLINVGFHWSAIPAVWNWMVGNGAHNPLDLGTSGAVLIMTAYLAIWCYNHNNL